MAHSGSDGGDAGDDEDDEGPQEGLQQEVWGPSRDGVSLTQSCRWELWALAPRPRGGTNASEENSQKRSHQRTAHSTPVSVPGAGK